MQLQKGVGGKKKKTLLVDVRRVPYCSQLDSSSSRVGTEAAGSPPQVSAGQSGGSRSRSGREFTPAQHIFDPTGKDLQIDFKLEPPPAAPAPLTTSASFHFNFPMQ